MQKSQGNEGRTAILEEEYRRNLRLIFEPDIFKKTRNIL